MTSGAPRQSFTEAEDQVLREALSGRGAKPWTRLMRQLGRTEVALRSRAYRLGLLVPVKRDKPRPAAGAAVSARRCLTCRESFQPEHRGNFVCDPCKATVTWRASA